MYPLTHAMHPSPPPPHTAVAHTSLPLTFSSSSQHIHNPSPPHAYRHAFIVECTHARRCSHVAHPCSSLLVLCPHQRRQVRALRLNAAPPLALACTCWSRPHGHALVAGDDHHDSQHIHSMHLPCPSTHEPLGLNRAEPPICSSLASPSRAGLAASERANMAV